MSPSRRAVLQRHGLLALAWAVGLALRLHAAQSLPRPLHGDEPWYAASAEDLVATDAPRVDPYIRPPGTTWWIASVYAVCGRGDLAALGIANALLLSTSVPLLAAIGRRALPDVRWAPWALAFAQAVNPFDIVHAGIVSSETLYIPLTLALVLVSLRAAETTSWPRVLAAAACGAVLVHVRTDCGPLVLAAFAHAALVARRGGAGWTRSLARFGVAAVLSVLLCVPWSVAASRERERPVFVSDPTSNPWFVERRGWWTWLSNVSMPRTLWLQTFWRGPPHTSLETLGPDAFSTPAEARAVAALLEQAHALRRFDAGVDASFRQLGEERIAREPLRFHVLLPLERTARIWLDPGDSDLPPGEGAHLPSGPLRVLHAWRFAARAAFGVGFLASLALFASASARGLAAGLVVVRTVTLMALFPLLGHGAKFESRNLANVEPLALVGVAAAADGLGRFTRWRSRRADAPQPCTR